MATNTTPLPCRQLLARTALLLSFLVFPHAAWPDSSELLNAVQVFLYEQTQHLGEEVHIEVNPPAARLPDCQTPRPFLPGNSGVPWGRVTVGIRCGETDHNVRYITARVTVIGQHVTPSQDLPPGTLIDATMLELTQGELSSLPPNAVISPDEAIGQVTRHKVAAGSILQRQQLHRPPLVLRGEKVIIESRGQGFRVTREGEALEPGALGDRVRVRLDPRQSLTAIVTGRGQLTMEQLPGQSARQSKGQ